MKLFTSLMVSSILALPVFQETSSLPPINPSVVLMGVNTLGSGTIINLGDLSFVLTAGHMCDGELLFEVRIPGFGSLPGLVSKIDMTKDLCLVEIPAAFNDAAKLAPKIELGNKMMLASNFPSMCQGILCEIRDGRRVHLSQDIPGLPKGNVFDTDMIKARGAIQPGNSGSAVIDLNFQIIGVISMSGPLDINGVGSTVYFVPVDEVHKFIHNYLNGNTKARG